MPSGNENGPLRLPRVLHRNDAESAATFQVEAELADAHTNVAHADAAVRLARELIMYVDGRSDDTRWKRQTPQWQTKAREWVDANPEPPPTMADMPPQPDRSRSFSPGPESPGAKGTA
jgi:hypothetical protein